MSVYRLYLLFGATAIRILHSPAVSLFSDVPLDRSKKGLQRPPQLFRYSTGPRTMWYFIKGPERTGTHSVSVFLSLLIPGDPISLSCRTFGLRVPGRPESDLYWTLINRQGLSNRLQTERSTVRETWTRVTGVPTSRLPSESRRRSRVWSCGRDHLLCVYGPYGRFPDRPPTETQGTNDPD